MKTNISQILITKKKEKVPPLIKTAIKTVQLCFKNCSYKLYNNEIIIDTIRKGFG